MNSERITVTKVETVYEAIDNSTGTPTPVINTVDSYNIGTAVIPDRSDYDGYVRMAII